MSIAPRVTINLSSVVDNYNRIAKTAAGAECGAVVKANAYGLGASEITEVLLDAGCRTYFVAQLSEATSLASQIRSKRGRLFILNGVNEQSVDLLLRLQVIPVLNSVSELRLWSDIGWPYPPALQIDTGFNRLGLAANEDAIAIERTEALPDCSFELVMSHLACADEPEHLMNREQLVEFDERSRRFNTVQRSLANSAGIYLTPEFHYDLVRPGIALYGGQPSANHELELSNVVCLQAQILQERRLPRGSRIGYAASFLADRPMRIAIVGAGYADGVPVALSNCGSVMVEGKLAPIVGRVSMDSFAIDVSALEPESDLQGRWVEIYGPTHVLEGLATSGSLLNYEVLTRIGRRVAFKYVA